MTVILDVEARSAQAQRDLAQINASLAKIEKSAASVGERFSAMFANIGRAAAVGGLATYVVSVSNEFASLSNQLALVTEKAEDFNRVQSKIISLSQQNRMAIATSSKIYTTLGKSMDAVQASTDQLFKATSTVQQAIALSGSGAQASEAAVIQLGQALASGTLRGEELNSVMEQTPRLAKVIADGLGVTLGQMRALAIDGKVTSKAVFESLLSQSTKVNAEFAKMSPTLSQGFAVLNTNVKLFVSELDKGVGATSALAAGLEAASKRMATMSVQASSVGGALSFGIGRAVDDIKRIGAPLASLSASIGKHLLDAMPQGGMTTTFFGAFKEGLRQVDDAAGGAFTNISNLARYGITDLIDYDSAAEAAFKKIKRLGPSSWITGGWDSFTLNRIFSRETLVKYGEAFGDLARAISGNSDSMFVNVGVALRKVSYGFRDVLRFVGLLPDTLFTFRIGNIDAMNYSLTEMLRGATGVQLKFTDIGKLMTEVFNGSSTRLYLAVDDVLMAVPAKVAGVVSDVIDLVVGSIPKIKAAFKDIIRSPIMEMPDLKMPSIRLPRIDLSALKLPDMGQGGMGGALDAISELGAKAVTSTQAAYTRVKDVICSAYEGAYKKVESTLKSMHSKVVGFMDQSTGLEKMTAVVTVFSEVLTSIVGPIALVPAMLMQIGVGFQTAFSPTVSQRIRDTIVEIVEWISKISPTLGNAISGFLGLDRSITLSVLAMGAWAATGNMVAAVASGIGAATLAMSIKIGQANRQSFFSAELGAVMDSMQSRMTAFTGYLEKAYESVAKFGKKVIKVFFEIYDEVVGHSWWPDTMDKVVEHASRLTGRVQPYLDAFQDTVNSTFEGLSKRSFKDRAVDFVVNVKTKVIGLKDSLVEAAKDFGVELPLAVKGLASALATVLMLAFLPLNKFTGLLIADMAVTALAAFGLIGEKLSQSMTGEGFSRSLGEQIGQIAGAWAGSFIVELPALISMLGGLAYGFAKSFVSSLLGEIPLIGKALSGLFSGVFSIADAVGMGGPLGIIGVALFGKGLMSLNTAFGDNIKWLTKLKGTIGSVADLGKAPGQNASMLNKLVFGAGGPGRVLSGIGLVATMLGSFDGMFAGSVIGKYGTMGLLGYMMLGGNPLSLLSKLQSTFITPLVNSVTGIGRAGLGSSNIFAQLIGSVLKSKIAVATLLAGIALLFSSSASAAENGRGLGEEYVSTWSRITSAISDMAGTLWKLSVDNPLQAFLAGWGVAITGVFVGKFLRGLLLVKKAAGTGLAEIAANTGLSAIGRGFATAASMLSGAFPKVSLQFGAMTTWMAAKWGEMALAMSGKMASIAKLPMIAPMVSQFSEMRSKFSASVDAMSTKYAAFMKRNGTRASNYALIGAAGAAGGAMTGDWTGAVEGAVAGAVLLQALGPRIQISLARIAAQVLGYLGAIVTAYTATVGIVLTLGAGLLYTMFFGEGNTFEDKLDDVWYKFKRFTGLTSEVRMSTKENKARAEKMTGDERDFVSRYKLGDAPDFSKVNFDLVKDGDKKAIDRAQDTYLKTVQSAMENKADTGTIDNDHRDAVTKSLKNLQNVLDRGAANIAQGLEHMWRNLDTDVQATQDGFLARTNGFFQQKVMDVGYWLTERSLKAKQSEAEGRGDKKAADGFGNQLSDLHEQKGKTFTWKYMPLDQQDKELQASIRSIKRPGGIDVPAIQNAFSLASTEFSTALKDYNDKRQGQLGAARGGSTYKKADVDVAAVRLERARKAMYALGDVAWHLEKRSDDVMAFNSALDGTVSKLKDAGATFDENTLFSSGDESFRNAKQYAEAINAMSVMRKEKTRSNGYANFGERIAAVKEELHLVQLLNLETQRGYDLNYSSPQAGTARLAEVTGSDMPKGATDFLDDDAAKSFMKYGHVIESVIAQLKSDTNIADIIAPPGTDALIEQRLKQLKLSGSRAAITQYMTELGVAAREALKAALPPNELLPMLAGTTGLALGEKDFTGYSAETAKTKVDMAAKADAQFKELQTRRAAINVEYAQAASDKIYPMVDAQRYSVIPELDALLRGPALPPRQKNGEEIAQDLVRKNDLLKQELGLRIQISDAAQELARNDKLIAPIIRTNSEVLEAQASLVGLTGKQFTTLPKSVQDHAAMLDFNLTNADHQLKSGALNKPDTIGWQNFRDQNAEQAEMLRHKVRRSGQGFSDRVSEFSNSGMDGVTLDNVFRIDPKRFVELDAMSGKIQDLMFELTRKGKGEPGYMETARRLFDAKNIGFNAATQERFDTRKYTRSMAEMVSEFGSAGMDTINLDSMFKIDPARFTELEAMRDEILQLQLDLTKKGMSSEFYMNAARNLYSKKNAATDTSAVHAAPSKASQDVNGLFGGQLDSATYLRGKTEFDALATKMRELNRAVEEAPAGLSSAITASFTVTRESILAGFDKIFSKVSTDYGSPLASSFGKSGITFDKSGLNYLTPDQKAAFQSASDEITAKQVYANRADISPEERFAAQEAVYQMQERLQAAVKQATLKPTERANYLIGESAATALLDSFTNGIKDMLTGAKKPKEVLAELADTFTKSVLNAFIEGLMNPLTGENGFIKQMTRSFFSDVFDLGFQQSNPMAQKVTGQGAGMPGMNAMGALSGVFKQWFGSKSQASTGGDAGAVADGATSMLTPDVDSIMAVNTMAKIGSTAEASAQQANAAMQAQGSGFTSMLTSLIGSVGSGISGLFRGFGDMAQQALMMLQSAMSGSSGPGLGSLASSLGSSGDTGGGSGAGWLSTIMSFFADGGFVSGAGTSTSDSIPAMLSNGEFVVNAAQTKRFAPLLHAINSGRGVMLAEGGLVGPGMALLQPTAMPESALPSTQPNAPVSQVFHLSFTGDISRQTKQQVLAMLPQIAAGVNAVNVEKGNRK